MILSESLIVDSQYKKYHKKQYVQEIVGHAISALIGMLFGNSLAWKIKNKRLLEAIHKDTEKDISNIKKIIIFITDKFKKFIENSKKLKKAIDDFKRKPCYIHAVNLYVALYGEYPWDIISYNETPEQIKQRWESYKTFTEWVIFMDQEAPHWYDAYDAELFKTVVNNQQLLLSLLQKNQYAELKDYVVSAFSRQAETRGMAIDWLIYSYVYDYYGDTIKAPFKSLTILGGVGAAVLYHLIKHGLIYLIKR